MSNQAVERGKQEINRIFLETKYSEISRYKKTRTFRYQDQDILVSRPGYPDNKTWIAI